MSDYLEQIGIRAKNARLKLGILDEESKNKGLAAVSGAIRANADIILSANEKDVEAAKNNGIPPALIDRLKLTNERINAMADGLIEVKNLEDPIGEVLEHIVRPNGLSIEKVRVPIGVIGIIYESRPNVTVDAFGLCFKSGNVSVLRGGSDAINSNKALVNIIREALKKSGLNEDSVILIEDTDRKIATELMRLNKYIDLLIPRGGAGLIRSVVENATIPVIETGTGNCHIFVDESADVKMAKKIIINAKTQRMGVCNACESLLVHKNIAAGFIPDIYDELTDKEIEIRAGEKAFNIPVKLDMKPAGEDDFYKEFLGPVISLQVVDNIDEAIGHVNKYTTHHSDCIVTNDKENAKRFMNEVDSACVYVNASTRFTDGFEFGFGAEIGISTQKLHARGPMGLKELTSYKYKVYGTGQIRG